MIVKEENGVHDRSLRRLAEERLAKQVHGTPADSGRDPLILVHELQVHQVELEMQNEELRRAQHEAEEQRRRYQDLYEFAPVGYLTVDDAGKVTAANLTASSLLGCKRSKLVGRPLFLFMAPESRGEYGIFLRRLHAGASGVRCEVLLGANAQRKGWLLLDGGTVKSQDSGRVVLVDITERKRFEEELLRAREAAEAAGRAKGQFLANMSHELRTPMTGVLGMVDLALGEELTPALRNYLETAAGSARSLLRLLNDILDMTKIEAGKFSLEEEPFSLRECAAGVIDLLTPEARRKGLALSLSVADGLPEIMAGDQLRLSQVLMNLVGNAIKFTELGHVKMSVTSGEDSAAGKGITFSVTDTGIGIPADMKEHIFQKFSQVDASHTRRFGGTGLGLAISREIVALMGGAITCETREGAGSTFSFTVPLRVADTLPEPAATNFHASQDGHSRLLLVEDDPVTRKLLTLMLGRVNFEVDIAENGQTGIEMLEKGSYNLVLMDVQMPGMDGFEATRIIREKEKSQGGRVPIVALTAYAQKEDEGKCLAAGMDGFISKPIDFQKCIKVIRDLLNRREHRMA